MANIIATGCHGTHVNNVLTPAGHREVDTSARWLLGQCIHKGITTVTLVTSQAQQAIESSARYTAILAAGGITVNMQGCDARLNPADGVDSILMSDAEEGIPPYGEGFIKWWGIVSSMIRLPTGVESYYSVGDRVCEVLEDQGNDNDDQTLFLAVFHRGCIEPGLFALISLSQHMTDLPSGALVVSNTNNQSYEVFNPADGSVTSGE